MSLEIVTARLQLAAVLAVALCACGEKKPEPVTVQDVDVDAVGLRELRSHYKTLKQTTRTEHERLQTLEKQLEEAKKAQGQTPAEVEAQLRDLQQKNQELSEALEQGYVENHPAIRAKYVDGRNKEVSKAHRILDAVKADAKAWDRAMSLPLEQRLEALEEIHLMMPQAAKDLLSRSESAIDELDLEKEQVFADRKGLREKLQQQDLLQRRAMFENEQKETLADLDFAEKDLVERLGIETLRKSDNPAHAKWNEGVDRRISEAKMLMLEVDDRKVMSRAALLAASALDYRQLWQSERDRRIEAEKRNKTFDQAEPRADDRGEEAPKGDDKMTFAEAVAASFPRR